MRSRRWKRKREEKRIGREKEEEKEGEGGRSRRRESYLLCQISTAVHTCFSSPEGVLAMLMELTIIPLESSSTLSRARNPTLFPPPLPGDCSTPSTTEAGLAAAGEAATVRGELMFVSLLERRSRRRGLVTGVLEASGVGLE